MRLGLSPFTSAFGNASVRWRSTRIDVELDGIGPTNHINTHTRTESGDFTFRSHVNGASREATASGTVNLDGTELIDSAPSGSLSDLHSGETTVTH